jgi:hypothetical protein
MHKTGTTALQKFFSLNAGALAGHGVCYPLAGRTAPALAHHDLANALKGPPFPLREPPASAAQYLSDIRKCFASFPVLLLSSEIFMRFVPAFKDRLALNLSRLDELAASANRVKVIIYLRRQDEYLESFYSQEIQHNLHMSFPDFVASRLPDYFQVCRELAEAFGKDNVIVRIYDRNRFTGGSIFSDFLSVLDIDPGDEFVIPEEDANPSLAPDEREFRKLINALDLPLQELMRFNEPLLQLSRRKRTDAAAPGSRLLCASERSALLGRCSAVNQRVASEFLGPEKAKGPLFAPFCQTTPAQDDVYPGLSQKALREIIGCLQQSCPELMALLATAVARSLRSQDQPARAAAALLQGLPR